LTRQAEDEVLGVNPGDYNWRWNHEGPFAILSVVNPVNGTVAFKVAVPDELRRALLGPTNDWHRTLLNVWLQGYLHGKK